MDTTRELLGNYITNMSLEHASGGWHGMNAALYAELVKYFGLHYVGPVNPPARLVERVWAKIQKALGRTQNFYFFSKARLNSIARQVGQQVTNSARFDYFHGITPWIASSISRPSFAYTDACFSTYCDTYHSQDMLKQQDLNRIASQEKVWLQRLTKVFFSSHYAIEECCRRYQVQGKNFECVGVGASMEMPGSDLYPGGHQLVFIAVDFARKGGRICVEAFRLFRERFADATLTFVGARPPAEVLELPGVIWTGFLSKEVPAELEQLKSHLASAFALVLPTVSDMTPLVVAEAALYGCPTIAPRAFGIPEMIHDGMTGRLLSTPPNADEFALALQEMASSQADYMAMRKATRIAAMDRFTWNMVGKRIASSIVRELEMHAS